MLGAIERRKAEILAEMERTDGAIASLEGELADAEEKNENDREQVEEQRAHQEARFLRELDGVRASVERAEKAARKAAEKAEEAERDAEEMKRKAGLASESEKLASVSAPAQTSDAKKAEEAARASARAVQKMLAGRVDRRELVRAILARNARLAEASREGLRSECGLPLASELPSVHLEEVAARNVRYESDPSRDGVKAAIGTYLQRRRAALREKALDLALTYLKRREQWRVRMVDADRARLEKQYGVKPGGKLPTPGVRGSARGGGVRGSFGAGAAVRTDYEELQVIAELQRREQLKTLVKLPAQILDPEERRHAAFRSCRNALVEDPKAEMEAAKLVRPWMDWERKIFHEKFSSYGKNFKRIATFIDGRTTADCVVYYYQTQKTGEGFRGRRKAQAKKRRAYAEAKRMTGGAWNGPVSSAPMTVAQQAKAAKEREAELRAAEEDRKGRSAEARQERAALAAAEKKKKRDAAKRKERDAARKAEKEAAALRAKEAAEAAAEADAGGAGSADKAKEAEKATEAEAEKKAEEEAAKAAEAAEGGGGEISAEAKPNGAPPEKSAAEAKPAAKAKEEEEEEKRAPPRPAGGKRKARDGEGGDGDSAKEAKEAKAAKTGAASLRWGEGVREADEAMDDAE